MITAGQPFITYPFHRLFSTTFKDFVYFWWSYDLLTILLMILNSLYTKWYHTWLLLLYFITFVRARSVVVGSASTRRSFRFAYIFYSIYFIVFVFIFQLHVILLVIKSVFNQSKKWKITSRHFLCFRTLDRRESLSFDKQLWLCNSKQALLWKRFSFKIGKFSIKNGFRSLKTDRVLRNQKADNANDSRDG